MAYSPIFAGEGITIVFFSITSKVRLNFLQYCIFSHDSSFFHSLSDKQPGNRTATLVGWSGASNNYYLWRIKCVDRLSKEFISKTQIRHIKYSCIVRNVNSSGQFQRNLKSEHLGSEWKQSGAVLQTHFHLPFGRTYYYFQLTLWTLCIITWNVAIVLDQKC